MNKLQTWHIAFDLNVIARLCIHRDSQKNFSRLVLNEKREAKIMISYQTATLKRLNCSTELAKLDDNKKYYSSYHLQGLGF